MATPWPTTADVSEQDRKHTCVFIALASSFSALLPQSLVAGALSGLEDVVAQKIFENLS